jgi:hypothetical protein
MIPRLRLELAVRMQRENVRRAESLVHALERLRARIRRHLERAEEWAAVAEVAAIECAVLHGEEQAIDAETWRQ